MTTADLVKELCRKLNVSISELARRIGQSRQNFSKKLKRDTLSLDELQTVADALGVTFEQSFTLPDGTRLMIESKRDEQCTGNASRSSAGRI